MERALSDRGGAEAVGTLTAEEYPVAVGALEVVVGGNEGSHVQAASVHGLLNGVGHLPGGHRVGDRHRGAARLDTRALVELEADGRGPVRNGDVFAVLDLRAGHVGKQKRIAEVEFEGCASHGKGVAVVQLGGRRGRQILAPGLQVADVQIAGGAEVEADAHVLHAGELAQVDASLPPIAANVVDVADVGAGLARLVDQRVDQRAVVQVGVGGHQAPVGPVVRHHHAK